MEPLSYEKRGYLREDFRLFHLADDKLGPMAYHYHTFHKIIFLLAGRTGYAIEGERYDLRPGDFVLVGRGSIHRPEAERGVFYERVILYISPEFLRAQSTAASQLDACFRLPADGQSFVLRPEAGRRAALLRALDALEEEERSTAYGHDLLARAQMLQLLVMLGRGLDDDGVNYAPSEHCNEKTAAILEYLNTHLTEDVSIDALADTFYLSKYYMMRMFREETGFTIHGYLTDKRLRVARDLIAQGMRTTDACFQCGYHDYSAFSRAYKKRFQVSPRADLTKGAQ